MLSSADLVRLSVHDDPLVRDHVLWSSALAEDHSGIDAATILLAVDKHGPTAFDSPRQVFALPVTQSVIERLIDICQTTQNSAVGEWLARLPQSLFAAHLPVLSQFARSHQAISQRIEISKLSPDALWDRAGAEYSELLPLTLCAYEEAIAPRVTATLARRQDPRELLAVEMAGRLRLGMAMNALLERLASPGALASAAARALGRLGTAGVVTAVELRCNREGPEFRREAAKALACTRAPSVEGALQRLLIEEDDAQAKFAFAMSLTAICTTTLLDRVCDVARSAGDATLRWRCASLAAMLNAVNAELQNWRGPRDRLDTGFCAVIRSAAPQTGVVSTLAARLDTLEGDLEDDPQTAPAPATPKQPMQPLRVAEKTGRNDPCPCGSGKKYKKCCGV